jgi:hypothetical protein
VLANLTQERRSGAASATSLLTPWSASSCTKPAFKIAMAPPASLLRFVRAIPGCAISENGRWKSSNVPTPRGASRLSLADGSYFRVARSLSKAGKGFRSDNRQRPYLGIRCAYPNPHPVDSQELEIKCTHYETDTKEGKRFTGHRIFEHGVYPVAEICIAPVPNLINGIPPLMFAAITPLR